MKGLKKFYRTKSLHSILIDSLIGQKESGVVEFKRAENSFDFDDLGEYFSALSNEANVIITMK